MAWQPPIILYPNHTFPPTGGQHEGEAKIWQLPVTVFNHQTHRRGQIHRISHAVGRGPSAVRNHLLFGRGWREHSTTSHFGPLGSG